MKEERVAIFGSSFDPPTGAGGHGGIVEYLSDRYETVLLLPVYAHAYSSKKQNVAFQDKLNMLELQFGGGRFNNVFVSCAESEIHLKGNGARFGTMDVLEYLQHEDELARSATAREFVFVMGADTLVDLSLGKWRRSEELLTKVHFLGIQRAGVDATALDRSKFAHLELVVIPHLTAVSSSLVRAKLARREFHELEALLDERVLQYIQTHHLYTHAADANGASGL